jgi:hypothetical protein
MNRKQGLGLLIIAAGVVVGLTVSFYLMTELYIMTGNPVGSILTVVGFSITYFGFAFLYVGNLEEDETSILWENEHVYSHPRGVGLGSTWYPFHLEKASVITGFVTGTSGPYDVIISDYFDIIESMARAPYIKIKPQIHLNGEGMKNSKNLFKIEHLPLPSGTYVLQFENYPVIDASFTLKKTVRKKPHEKLYDFGLTLLEVGVPVLITGAISLGFGTFVS